MQRISLFLFRALAVLSNALALLLVVAGGIVTLGAPAAVYLDAMFHELDLPEHYFLWLALCGLLTALGALLVLKRKRIGVLLSLAPAVAYGFWGQFLVATTYAVVIVTALGIPVLLHGALTKRAKTGAVVA